MSAGASAMNYELAGDLKIGQVGIANLRIRTLDVERLGAEMRDRVARAPKLFERAAVIVDFGALPGTPDAASALALLDALRAAGVIPVALAYGSSDNERLAVELGLPLLAKFRAQYESPDAAANAPAPKAVADTAPAKAAAPTAAKAPAASGEPGMIQTAPIRSGQQIYAEQRDLTILSAVGAGAEVIADGSIHIYGALRGRALAGARDNDKARIFCREFHAELVAIAGHYKVMEDIPAELRGKAVQIWLDNGQIHIAALA
ncbi:septum site-determining protein MinC [Lysobacter hankyongensis]|uniref:Probable septum site-determining protein MinC n=1 Tax=Lysobacter hankyongensis TaxID=1176535 RepID=A0ABP9AHY7_9GAMM